MNREEEAVIEQIYRLMEKSISPIVLSVSDSVQTTSRADETNHIFSVTIEAPRSRSQFTVFRSPVPDTPGEVPGDLISYLFFQLENERNDLFSRYSPSLSKKEIKPDTTNIAFEINKQKAIPEVEKNVFESMRDEILGRVAGVTDSIFVLEVVIEDDKAQVIIAPYEGKGDAAKVFEVFAGGDLKMPGRIIQKILNDAIINHFLGTVIKFEVMDEKGHLIDAHKIPPQQNHIIFRRIK